MTHGMCGVLHVEEHDLVHGSLARFERHFIISLLTRRGTLLAVVVKNPKISVVHLVPIQ